MTSWNKRYATEEYVFGREPSYFLVERKSYFKPGQVALLVADGEGRNGVYVAQQGLRVHSVDNSMVGLRKAKKLADEVGVDMFIENVDILDWTWHEDSYDHVVGIFIQFATPEQRKDLFANMVRALKPGGHLLLHGYRPEQVELGTGGPPNPDHMYTEEMLREAFGDLEIIELTEEDREIEEGKGHRGQSALINLVARKPQE